MALILFLHILHYRKKKSKKKFTDIYHKSPFKFLSKDDYKLIQGVEEGKDCNNWGFNASDFDILSNLILEEEFDVSAEKKNSRYSRALQNFEPNDVYMNDKSNKVVEIDERHLWIIKTYERFMGNQNKSSNS